jgi:hypothetical protein
MRYWLLRISLLVCLATPFAGQSDNEWHRYKNDAGNFSVLLPAKPQESAVGEKGEQSSQTIQVTAGPITYLIVYVTTKTEQPVNEATFNVYRDSFLKGLPNCDLASELPASPAVGGYVGHWYRLNCRVGEKKVSMVGNLYWGKHHAYAVLAMFSTASPDPPTAKKFADSFSIINGNQ